ncbi:hypothetical protein QBC34DRAFT_466531 [Podospora aff. communis PSN243]|uniref:Uncharacterized protein n=1 Tax=Podospora aff. communis PSN243 TaxID=3040156 RepID=A0AAV9GKJ1_9PEZI|nr:hypothetical protein QBC34DRAFT_466531 [Podospora aff. communis PSN243]
MHRYRTSNDWDDWSVQFSEKARELRVLEQVHPESSSRWMEKPGEGPAVSWYEGDILAIKNRIDDAARAGELGGVGREELEPQNSGELTADGLRDWEMACSDHKDSQRRSIVESMDETTNAQEDPRCLYKALLDLADKVLPMRRLLVQKRYRAHLQDLAGLNTKDDIKKWAQQWDVRMHKLIRYKCTDASDQGVWFDDLLTAASNNAILRSWSFVLRGAFLNSIVMGTRQMGHTEAHYLLLQQLDLMTYMPEDDEGSARRRGQKRKRGGGENGLVLRTEKILKPLQALLLQSKPQIESSGSD